MKAKKFDILNRINSPIAYFRAPTSFSNIKQDSIPQNYISLDGFRLLEEPENKLKVTFLGDMMGVGPRNIKLSAELLERINSSDYTIINLSSVITNEHSMVIERQHTHPQVFLNFCDQLPMDKVIFSLANNHVMDFGQNGLDNTLLQLRRVGAKVIGLADRAELLLVQGLKIKASTCWYTDKDITSNISEDSNCEISTLHYLHWGEEYKSNPSEEQVEYVKNLGKNNLLICGHHSHCPQPIKMINNKLTAFSLGNFTTCHNSEKINSGLVMSVDLVQYANQWSLEQVNWKLLDISATDIVKVSEI